LPPGLHALIHGSRIGLPRAALQVPAFALHWPACLPRGFSRGDSGGCRGE
jgi:hypothetical protein